MWPLIHGAADLVAQHPILAILIAFAAAILEAVAVLGIVLPGTPVLMAVAGAAALAGQPVTPILLVAIAGAVIGDYVSFWIGHHYSARLRRVWPFASRPWLIAEAERFFRRYGTASVALCRFVPVLRSTVPLVAGMAGMPQRRFLLANVASALVWAPLHVLPAGYAGLSLGSLESGDWQPVALGAAGLALLTVAGWALHRRLTRPGQPRD